MDDDDVIDYMVMEAVAIKIDREVEKDEKKKEVSDWKRDKSGLEKMRAV